MNLSTEKGSGEFLVVILFYCVAFCILLWAVVDVGIVLSLHNKNSDCYSSGSLILAVMNHMNKVACRHAHRSKGRFTGPPFECP